MDKIKIKGNVMIMAFLCLSLLVFAGCQPVTSPQAQQQRQGLENVANTVNVHPGDSFDFEQKLTEKNQQGLIKATQPPTLQGSLERENLIRRYDFMNDRDKMFYVYLFSKGEVVSFFVAKGKTSSVNSRLTQEEQIVADPRCIDKGYSGESSRGMDVECYKTVGSPQLDGSYGSNGDGIFFYTTEGAYVEWNEEYLVSDFPLKITTPVALEMRIE